jgi:hypothetical protein
MFHSHIAVFSKICTKSILKKVWSSFRHSRFAIKVKHLAVLQESQAMPPQDSYIAAGPLPPQRHRIASFNMTIHNPEGNLSQVQHDDAAMSAKGRFPNQPFSKGSSSSCGNWIV